MSHSARSRLGSAWLFIDTHELGTYRFGWISEKRTSVRSYKGRPHDLLTRLASSWGKQNVAGVAVVAGPGSFSAIRIGVLHANLLARFAHLPLVSLYMGEHEDFSYLNTHARATFVAPIYHQDPNITVKKK